MNRRNARRDDRSDSELPAIIDLENPSLWPDDLVAYLEDHLELFIAWEGPRQTKDSYDLARQFDRAIHGLSDILRQYALLGWHCTKLTEAEIQAIVAHGMTPPNARILNSRVAALEGSGIICADVAARLRANNQADESNRAGRLWFCFFAPHIAGESGIERFFRSWDGEALYNSTRTIRRRALYLLALAFHAWSKRKCRSPACRLRTDLLSRSTVSFLPAGTSYCGCARA